MMTAKERAMFIQGFIVTMDVMAEQAGRELTREETAFAAAVFDAGHAVGKGGDWVIGMTGAEHYDLIRALLDAVGVKPNDD